MVALARSLDFPLHLPVGRGRGPLGRAAGLLATSAESEPERLAVLCAATYPV